MLDCVKSRAAAVLIAVVGAMLALTVTVSATPMSQARRRTAALSAFDPADMARLRRP
jgi:hypothetical protein